MAIPGPLVLESVDLLTFITYMLDQHAPPSTIVVCSSKEAFLQQLYESSTKPPGTQHPETNDDLTRTGSNAPSNAQDPLHKDAKYWQVPTLRLLASSRTILLAFCPDITNLRAYLAAYPHREVQSKHGSSSVNKSTPLLAVLNPIQVHRPTSAFSAQGLNRTFSIAVEAAHKTQSRLVLAECSDESDVTDQADEMSFEEAQPGVPTSVSPWDEEVSILNVTTKSFGAGERGWVGRTVKIRSIAERWCIFQDRTPTTD